MGDFTFDLKESYRRFGGEIRERSWDVLTSVRDFYLHTPALRAAVDSLLLLGILAAIDLAMGHQVGARMMFILPVWLAAKRGGRTAGYVTVAATTLTLGLLDLRHGSSDPIGSLLNALVQFAILASLMAFIEHFETSLRKYANLAKRDALTGALNRLGMDEYMNRAIDRALGHGSQLTVAMIDCNKFKELNDEFGHDYGDHVLKTLARLLRRYSQGGIVARNGGDEFVLALPGRSQADARAILNRVNWKLREATILNDRSASFTFGLARVGVDGTNTRDLISAADRDMYIHKSARLDLAVVESPDIVPMSA